MRRSVLAAAVACALTSASPSPAADLKFALAMPHFNVQYVAGGMVGFWSRPDPRLDLSAEQIEDLIVASLDPVLDLLGKHPTWATDVEMQAYMLDVIAARHPKVLDKIKKLTSTGQLEVVSFHYSDQLFIAHAPEDWERSADLTKATFDKHGVPLGTAVFCQEGQAGPGMAAAMKAHGYSILVWPKNLWSYQHGDASDGSPLYKFGDVFMTTSRGGKFDVGAGNTVEVRWTFVDDGELLATGGRNPYTPDIFYVRPAAVDAYEAQLVALEADGFQITTVQKYLEAVKGVATPKDPPPLLDGTWQPNSTDGAGKWLGARGIHGDDERDNDVRTLAAIAHRELVVARAIAKKAGIDVAAELEAAFRLLALGEVSDASGINPFRGEIEYGIAHCTEVIRLARGVVNRAKTALGAAGKTVTIDAAKGEVTIDGPTAPAASPLDPPPLALSIDGGDRVVDTKWTKRAGHSVATVHFGAGSTYSISVKVPGSTGEIAYTPALTSAPVHLPKSAFSFDHFMLPLHDGLLGLGGARWLLKDQGFVHVAARIDAKSGDVIFKDDTTRPEEEITWVFHLVEGDDAAASNAAAGLNVLPTVWR